VNAALGAKLVLCHASIEAIRDERVAARQQLELIRFHD